jgi:hypothetical protein
MHPNRLRVPLASKAAGFKPLTNPLELGGSSNELRFDLNRNWSAMIGLEFYVLRGMSHDPG